MRNGLVYLDVNLHESPNLNMHSPLPSSSLSAMVLKMASVVRLVSKSRSCPADMIKIIKLIGFKKINNGKIVICKMCEQMTICYVSSTQQH